MPFWMFQDLTTYRASSIFDYTNQNFHVSEESRHVGEYPWPISQIAGVVGRYHPSMVVKINIFNPLSGRS